MRYRSPSFRYWTVNVGKSTSLIQIQTMGPQAPEKKGANAYATRKTTVQGVLNTAAITRTALMLKDYINDYESTPIRNTVIVQCVRATFTLAVVVTVVNQKSPKSPVGGISPNLWTKTCRVSNSDWKNGITSVISLAQSKLRSIGRRANQPPLTFCPLAWFLGKLF